MESVSQSEDPASRPTHSLANIVGTFIAVLTLTLPIFVIASYSSSQARSSQPSVTQPFQSEE